MKGVWLMHSQAYSYHSISITAACSVGATEVITSVYCYLMPTISFNHKRKLLGLEMFSIDCVSSSLSS